MPFGDRTGPLGLGPMTGRGLGICGRLRGYGRGYGFRRGFGFRAGYPQVLSKEEEKRLLEEELRLVNQEKAEIERRLNELNKE
ncbi:MAG TPA: hypothetical protein ENL09_01150 [Bacteroidetes bacterium]|nr:hypothetical protein [Bacteroidota bacterium]